MGGSSDRHKFFVQPLVNQNANTRPRFFCTHVSFFLSQSCLLIYIIRLRKYIPTRNHEEKWLKRNPSVNEGNVFVLLLKICSVQCTLLSLISPALVTLALASTTQLLSCTGIKEPVSCVVCVCWDLVILCFVISRGLCVRNKKNRKQDFC